MITVNSDNLVEWILANRRGKAFVDYPREVIKTEIEKAYKMNCLEVTKNPSGQITGVLVAEPKIYIKHILTTDKKSFFNLTRIMNLKFFGLKWMARRKDKLVEYDNVDRAVRLASVVKGVR